MHKYVIKRLLSLIPVLFIVSIVIFMLIHLVPGDPAAMMLGEQATPAQIEALRETLGLNEPLVLQYIHWVRDIFRGDLGTSLFMDGTMLEIISTHMVPTLQQTVVAILFATLVGVPLGMLAAIKRGRAADQLISTFSIIGVSMPSFLMGLGLVLLFSVKLGWLPSTGAASWKSFILPAFTCGTGNMAALTRTTRSAMLDVLKQDYLRTARSKGVSERRIIMKHALKNAQIPIVTMIGIQVSTLIGGAVLTERVFALPGVGSFLVDSILKSDFEVVTGFIIMLAIFVSVVLLIVDIVYAFLDPRIKAQYSKS